VGKRSDFERAPRDFYPTPAEAVYPLLPHISAMTSFIEPCAGDGALMDHLADAGHVCWGAMDIEPKRHDIERGDALETRFALGAYTVIITNPPWDRKILHPMITKFSDAAPTWLLFDADWMHTRQSAPFMERLKMVVSVGRVKWIPDSKMTGKDNCCWYLFDKPSEQATTFVGRISR